MSIVSSSKQFSLNIFEWNSFPHIHPASSEIHWEIHSVDATWMLIQCTRSFPQRVLLNIYTRSNHTLCVCAVCPVHSHRIHQKERNTSHIMCNITHSTYPWNAPSVFFSVTIQLLVVFLLLLSHTLLVVCCTRCMDTGWLFVGAAVIFLNGSHILNCVSLYLTFVEYGSFCCLVAQKKRNFFR